MKAFVLMIVLAFAAHSEVETKGDLGPAELEVLKLFNIERAKGGYCGGSVMIAPSKPLIMDNNLRMAARAHSSDMSLRNYFSHTSYDGRTWLDRIYGSGFTGYATGENIAAGYTTPTALVKGWMASPGHCRNILNAYATHVGIGWSYRVSAYYRFYWTADFGVR